MRQLIIFAAIMLAAGVYLARMADRTAGQAPSGAAAMVAQSEPTPTTSNYSRTITLSPGNGGHFWTEARVDGRRIEFVVDTGATTIALRATDAARLGIHPSARDYSIKVATANGSTRAALVQLGMVEVGNIVVRNVPATVNADDALSVNLLGMSFLSRVRWTHERGKLILEQ
jgi:aspartyl protease family protein